MKQLWLSLELLCFAANPSLAGLPAALTLQANGSSLRGLIIVRCTYGASGCVIAGNWIGMDADGLARGMTFDGISATHMLGVAMNNTIGGTAPADRNVISGNSTGVSFFPIGYERCGREQSI